MLTIVVPESELFDSSTNEFIQIKEQTLQLEHSLVSIQKWESRWKKSFLNTLNERSIEETIDYIRCMTITKNVNPLIYRNMNHKVINQVNEYINDPMTATTFNDRDKSSGREVITAELIYYWMVNFGIPFECKKWHLNQLLTLIKVCALKAESSNKKMSKSEIMKQNRDINALRRKRLNSKG